MAEAFRIEQGSVFLTRACRRTAEDQAQIYRTSGLEDDSLSLDPFLALIEGIYAIGDAVRNAYSGWGAVVTSQHVTVSKLHPVRAPAFVRGRVTAFERRQRGPVFETAIAAIDAGGEPFAETLTTIQLLDPSVPSEKSDRAPPRADPAPPLEVETISRFTFTPEAVRCFEKGLPPSLHSDLNIARSAGFPKPIVSGNQVFSILWTSLVAPRYALPLELRFTLKRPIFWDDTISFERRTGGPEGLDMIEVRNASGKACILCEISGARIGRLG